MAATDEDVRLAAQQLLADIQAYRQATGEPSLDELLPDLPHRGSDPVIPRLSARMRGALLANALPKYLWHSEKPLVFKEQADEDSVTTAVEGLIIGTDDAGETTLVARHGELTLRDVEVWPHGRTFEVSIVTQLETAERDEPSPTESDTP